MRVLASTLCLVPTLLGAGACGTTLEEHALDVAGTARRYYTYTPAQLDPAPRPAVLILHGGGGRADSEQGLARYSRFAAKADDEHFLAVFPSALKENWNDGRGAELLEEQRTNVDDLAYFDALVERLVADHGVDRARIYVTGISNGGMMTIRLACERADRFAAFAPVAAAMPEPIGPTCTPTVRPPIMMFHGTRDAFVPFEGGHVTAPGTDQDRGPVWGVRRTFEHFAAHNGCTGSPAVETVNDRPDGTSVEHLAHGSCTGAETHLFIIHDGGHTWPGSTPLPYLGRVTREIHAADIMWPFFARHARR